MFIPAYSLIWRLPCLSFIPVYIVYCYLGNNKAKKMINIAVIGAGPWGCNHIRIYNNLLDVELAYVVEKDPAIRKKITEQFGVTCITDYHDLLKGRVDAFSICTPASTHYEIAKDALNARINVLVEKPLTLSPLDAAELVTLSKKQKKILAVGHVFRFDPAIRKVKEEIKKGTFGKIYYLSLSRLGLKKPREDVGAIFNYAIHDLDIMCDVLDQEPKEITAVVTNSLGREFEDHAIVLVKFSDGAVGYSQVGWLTPKKLREFWIVGEKRSACIDPVNFEVEIFESGIVPEYNDFGTFRLITKEGMSYKPEFDKTEPLKEELKHFIDCINLGKEPINNGKIGAQAVKLASLALVSSKEKRSILVR